MFYGILSLVFAGYAAGVLAQGAGTASFIGAEWIWSGPPDSNDAFPVGNVTFRRDYTPPNGRVPISANISITADNTYTLYVNGLQIGVGSNFHQADGYCVRLDQKRNVFAVVAHNQPLAANQPTAPNPAGLLAAIGIRLSDGSTDTMGTDDEWHAVVGTPEGFEQVAFDDSAWPAAVSQGPWPNTGPWDDAPQTPSLNQDISCASINMAGGSGKINVGAIVGGAVGGVIITVLVLAAFFWWRSRKHRASQEPERQQHLVYSPFYPDLVDRSLASTALPSTAAGTLSSHRGPSQDLRTEVEQLRREMEALRSGRTQESEPPPLYEVGCSNNVDGVEHWCRWRGIPTESGLVMCNNQGSHRRLNNS